MEKIGATNMSDQNQSIGIVKIMKTCSIRGCNKEAHTCLGQGGVPVWFCDNQPDAAASKAAESLYWRDLRKSVETTSNHHGLDESDRQTGELVEPLDDTECFCVRCCAIRLLRDAEPPEPRSTDAGQAAETMAEQLHVWYLEATQALDPANYNPKAQKSYAELNEQQKEIDRYIARKVLALQHRPNPRQAAEPDPLLVNEGENIDYCSGQKFVSTDWLERLANRFERRANKIYRSTGYCTEEQRQTMTAIFDGIAEEIRAEVNYRPEPRSTEFQPPPTCSKCGYHVEIVDGICLNCGEPFPARSTEAGQAAGEWLEVQWRVTRLQAIVTHGGYEELSQTIVAALRSQQQDTERLVALLDAYSNGDDTRPAVAVLSDIE